MVPKLDDNGEPMRLKTPNPQTGKTVKEERRLVDTFSEFYLSDKADIETFIHTFAVNADHFKVEEFFVDLQKTEPSKVILPGQ